MTELEPDVTPGVDNRSVSRRAVLGGLAAAAAAPLLGACSGSSSDVSANGQVTLDVVGFEVDPDQRNTPLDNAYKKFLADFQKQHPKIKINSQQTPPNFDTQIIVDLASGSAPDLWSQDASSLAPLIQRNLLLDMRKCIKKVPSLDSARFFPSVLDIHRAKDGSLYGLPNDFTPMVVYYNPTSFAKAKMAPPKPNWTWDDQLQMAKQLTLDSSGRSRLDSSFDESNVVQWGYRLNKYTYGWVYRVWQNGGDVLSPDRTTASGFLDSDATVEAIQWYADLVLEHKVSPSPSTLDNLTHTSDFDTLFTQGKFAMFDSGHWELVGLAASKYYKPEMLAVIPQPRRKNADTVLYESSFVVRHDLPDDKIEAVAHFVDAATGRQYQDTKDLTGIALAGNEAAARASLTDRRSPFRRLDKTFVDVAANGRRPYGSILASYPTVEKLLDGMMEKILHGSSVKDEIHTTVQAVDQELKSR